MFQQFRFRYNAADVTTDARGSGKGIFTGVHSAVNQGKQVPGGKMADYFFDGQRPNGLFSSRSTKLSPQQVHCEFRVPSPRKQQRQQENRNNRPERRFAIGRPIGSGSIASR